jgi:hypothetical protein
MARSRAWSRSADDRKGVIGRREADVRLRSEPDSQFAMQLTGSGKWGARVSCRPKSGHWHAVHAAFGAGFEVFSGRDVKFIGKSVYRRQGIRHHHSFIEKQKKLWRK